MAKKRLSSKVIDQLLQQAEALGLGEDDLDDEVHQAKSEEAASINNDGLRGQIEYLYNEWGYTGALEVLERIAEDKKEEEE